MVEGSRPHDQPSESIFGKAVNAFTAFESFESSVLAEIGFSGPPLQKLARSGEVLLGSGMIAVGGMTAELGIGVPLAIGGAAVAADGLAGLWSKPANTLAADK